MKKYRWLMIALALACVMTLAACGTYGTDAGQDEQSTQGTQVEQDSAAAERGNAPDFTVLDAQGKPVKLSDFYGKPVVLNFWATWCGYCKMEMPDFEKAYQANPDVVFLMVNATDGVYETVDTAKAYVASEGYTFNVYFDVQSQAVNAYGLTGYPTTVFINAQGDVVSKRVGMINYDILSAGIDMITQ